MKKVKENNAKGESSIGLGAKITTDSYMNQHSKQIMENNRPHASSVRCAAFCLLATHYRPSYLLGILSPLPPFPPNVDRPRQSSNVNCDRVYSLQTSLQTDPFAARFC